MIKTYLSYLSFVVLMPLIITSCSDSDSLESEKNNEEDVVSIKLLKSVVDNREWTDIDDSIGITYTNNLMQTFDDIGEKQFIEYNSDNKVSNSTNQFDEIKEFFYEKGRLKMISDGDKNDEFTYDQNGNVTSVIETVEGEYNQSTFTTYNYKGDVVTYRIGPENTEHTSVYTFEFDDKINPFYSLWSEFGFFVDLEVYPYDIIPLNFKHNPTKIYEDNELEFEISYTYDNEGYPMSCSYTKYSSTGESNGTVLFTYL
ncbi:hypothetical protein H4O18_05115 [Arenibacter sp. BSSL-BM3]|uniref:DUF4595 domain-containing protein n=1 Tax=Arenibacter arenosicollis TaxID=2762274 RepID=A0ABR7QJK5_9FLAO|nr:hypothetical protein [Arenibacter arenosicollis]MBC8767366.1 hypothetical protein [Arenibacter arenosicollis]